MICNTNWLCVHVHWLILHRLIGDHRTVSVVWCLPCCLSVLQIFPSFSFSVSNISHSFWFVLFVCFLSTQVWPLTPGILTITRQCSRESKGTPLAWSVSTWPSPTGGGRGVSCREQYMFHSAPLWIVYFMYSPVFHSLLFTLSPGVPASTVVTGSSGGGWRSMDRSRRRHSSVW